MPSRARARDTMPDRGLAFWPVGNGDSTTVLINHKTVLQVDLHDMAQADEADDPHVPVIDRLVELLPTGPDGRPYLAGFALTHPDLDHCRGFADLLERVTIGELWLTPRVFRDNTDEELSQDAQAYCDEAMRRVKTTIASGGVASSGDRVRLVGYDDLLAEDDFQGFPKEQLTIPGTAVTTLDGTEHAGVFRAFIHSPFKGDSAGTERNETSLGMQITLWSGACAKRALLLGDLGYPTIRRIFDLSEPDDLAWDVLLAPHHCSKRALYWPDELGGQERLRDDLVKDLDQHAQPGAYVVASSRPMPPRDEPHADPPHLKAKHAYEGIVDLGHFLCTSEHPNTDQPEPIVIAVADTACGYQEPTGRSAARAGLSDAVARSRGTAVPPARPHGFGR
jgi:hypothetical protein